MWGYGEVLLEQPRHDGAPWALELVRRLLTQTELPARTLHPTHCNRLARLWEEAMELGREQDGVVDVTAFPADDPSPSAAACIAGWFDSGNNPARITCSSDGGGCLPQFDDDGLLMAMGIGDPSTLLRTVAELLADGLELPDALRPVTSNPAALFRLHGKGRLAAGADADVVVLDEAGSAHHVLSRGRWMVRDGRPQVTGVFE